MRSVRQRNTEMSAIIEAYRVEHPGPFVIEDGAEWAIANGKYSVEEARIEEAERAVRQAMHSIGIEL